MRFIEASFPAEHHRTGEAGATACIDWTIFRFSGFRIAYPFFPAGLASATSSSPLDLGPHLSALRKRRVDVVDLVLGPTGCAIPSRSQVQRPIPVSRIDDLGSWDEASIDGKCRAKIRRASRLGVHLRPAHADEGEFFHDLYQKTITRKTGRKRYSRGYFVGLARLSQQSPDLRIGVALDDHRRAVGFIAILFRHGVAYYLHGAYDESARSLRPGFACMEWAIRSARDAGCTAFDMLASPRGQSGLIEFKESFGAVTTWCTPVQLALSLKGYAAVQLRRLFR
jgi:hypothetical protein